MKKILDIIKESQKINEMCGGVCYYSSPTYTYTQTIKSEESLGEVLVNGLKINRIQNKEIVSNIKNLASDVIINIKGSVKTKDPEYVQELLKKISLLIGKENKKHKVNDNTK